MKKAIIIIIFIGLLFTIGQSVQATGLLLKYPTIKDTTPTSQGLPEFIKYIYLFALGAAGFVALLAILIGAIMYVFSAGNPQKAGDAKNRILSALLGILILLASVLILRTINPNLVEMELPSLKIKPTTTIASTRFSCWCCCSSPISLGLKKCDPLKGWRLFTCEQLEKSFANEFCKQECSVNCGNDNPLSKGWYQLQPCASGINPGGGGAN